ncbi:hypothetical protein GGF42_003138 [Coemansia sp. RSA 2424]|nr:hypothetical protein GGF42_003138 [Coemansia sp. RSA 2424]
MWTWLAAIPRVSVRIILRVLDVFESTMLTFVWEYQGENILKYLFQHHYIQSGVAVACAHPSAALQQHSKSQTTQTETSPGDELARQQVETLDRLANDLMPSLLSALNELPQQVESGWQLVHGIGEQSPSPSSVAVDLELQPLLSSCASGKLGAIEAGLQSLVDKIGKADIRLSQLQHAIAEAPLTTARHAEEYDDRLASVVNNLSAVKAKCEADRMLALQLVQSLAALDATLASLDTLPREAAMQVADAIVQTDEPTQEVSRNDSMFTDLAETQVATPTHTGNEHAEMMYSSSSSISTDDDAEDSANDADASTSDSDQCSVRSLKSLQMYANEGKMAPLVGNSDSIATSAMQDPPSEAALADPAGTGKPEAIQSSKAARHNRFSIRRGIRRYSWFGKKVQPTQVLQE